MKFFGTELETLSIANNSKLTDFVTQFGIRFLPNLKQIKMPGCIKVSRFGFLVKILTSTNKGFL